MYTTARLIIWAVPALALMILVTGSVSVAAARPYGACPVGGYAIPACPVATDQVIRDQIASRLAGSVGSRRYPITVGVCNGVVTLRGTVETQGRRDLANLFTWSVQGVVQVNNELIADPNVLDDMTLIGQVKSAINKQPIDSNQVHVRVNDGVVELTGIVYSELARDQAAWAAQAVPGVAAVYNNLVVRGTTVGNPF